VRAVIFTTHLSLGASVVWGHFVYLFVIHGPCPPVGHNTIIHSMALNHDNVLMSGGDNGSLYFWDYKTGAPTRCASGGAGLWWCGFVVVVACCLLLLLLLTCEVHARSVGDVVCATVTLPDHACLRARARLPFPLTGYNFQRLQTRVQPGSMAGEAGILAATFDHSGSRLITCVCEPLVTAVSCFSLLSLGVASNPFHEHSPTRAQSPTV
jgi:hypothetical protein